jgi:hypothetical protein
VEYPTVFIFRCVLVSVYSQLGCAAEAQQELDRLGTEDFPMRGTTSTAKSTTTRCPRRASSTLSAGATVARSSTAADGGRSDDPGRSLLA